MSRFFLPGRASYRLLTGMTAVGGLVIFVLPSSLAAQNVEQQGWNPKEILAKETYQKPPAVVERIVSAPRNAVVFTNPSPDGKYFLKAESEGLSTIEVFGKPHYRLGGLEIDWKANRVRALTTRGAIGLTLLDPTSGATRTIETPKGAIVNDPQWSPDGKSIAYIASFDAATHIYVADVASGKSVQVTKTPLLAVRVSTFQWTADGSRIVTVLLPDNRPPEPKAPAIETGPLVRMTEGTVHKNVNYASLLRDQHDKDLLDYYSLGQLAVIDVKTKAEKKIGQPALFTAVDASPDGQYFRVTLQEKPYSYIVPVANFGTVEQLWDANGHVLVPELSKRPLSEGRSSLTDTTIFGVPAQAQEETAKRNVAWNPVGPGLIYLQGEPAANGRNGNGGAAPAGRGRGRGGQGGGGALSKDQVFEWLPPFAASDSKSLFETNARITAAEFSRDGKTLFVNEGNNLYAVRLSDPSKHYEIARGASIAVGGGRGRGGAGGGRGGAQSDSAFYNNPGALQTERGPNGLPVVRLASDGKTVYLEGTHYYADWTTEAPRNFVDKVDFETGQKTSVFEGKAGVSESVVAPLDDNYSKVIVARESPSTVQDSYLRDLSTGAEVQLTHNVDFAPEVTHAIRKRILVTRPGDDFKFWLDVTLPASWRPGQRLPGIIWFYPREFSTQADYDRTKRTGNIDAFPNVAARSPEIWVTQGYAVLQPDNPIVGLPGHLNDHYVDELRRNLDATLEAADSAGFIDKNRMGIGGHSYGAFSTMNAMVHTPYFKAGIAGDGMYNRTLTPFGFQSERREFWQDESMYEEMSPFMYADRLSGAILMYHSLEDQNVGTDPISSIRMMHALEGEGKTAALFMYPYEDHGPATRESDLDQWARWIAWFDVYVKNPKNAKTTAVVP